MDSSQAKQVLKFYRPGNIDAADPQMAEALATLPHDPELDQWFQEHCASYQAIRGKLKQIKVPADLKRKILLNHVEHRPNIIPLSSPALLVLAAAAIVLIIGLSWAFFSPNYEHTFPAYRDRMALSAQRPYNMAMTSNDPNQVRDYLRTHHGDADYTLPHEMEKLTTVGCALMDWQSRRVSMLCVKGRDNKDLYLFVANRATIPNAPPPGKTQYQKVHKLLTASWTNGDRVYVLAGPYDQAGLQQYLN